MRHLCDSWGRVGIVWYCTMPHSFHYADVLHHKRSPTAILGGSPRRTKLPMKSSNNKGNTIPKKKDRMHCHSYCCLYNCRTGILLRGYKGYGTLLPPTREYLDVLDLKSQSSTGIFCLFQDAAHLMSVDSTTKFIYMTKKLKTELQAYLTNANPSNATNSC